MLRLRAVYGAQNANQKEKFEAELKSQIKKLQVFHHLSHRESCWGREVVLCAAA